MTTISDPATATEHRTITPKILYFGTPVVLLSTENDDGTANVAPISSAWALGHSVVLGLGPDGQSAHNLATRPDMVINLPGPHQWEAVERLAPLTGRHPVPAAKRDRFRYESAKFQAAGLQPQPPSKITLFSADEDASARSADRPALHRCATRARHRRWRCGGSPVDA
jgi:flavin reductase (DIM6/NTAB) family NADH-FMN oxidoreductase RutF